MYQVLIPVDMSVERAMLQARRVAELPVDGVHAVLFHVFTDNPEGASVQQLAPVRRAAERLTEAGVEVTMAASSGEPTDEICARAAADDVDLICVAGRKRTPAGKLLFGSVSRVVLLESDRPVLFCTESAESPDE
jgi:nucleotide-binding universal stress UspA family protein